MSDSFINYLRTSVIYYTGLDKKWFIISVILFGLLEMLLRLYGHIEKKRAITVSLLVSYLFLVLSYMVLLRKPTGSYHYELELFWTYREIMNGQITYIAEAVLNIVLFIPIGILLAMLKVKWQTVVRTGFGCSCFVEILQLVTTRGLFEFDDIFHNTIGAAVGFVIYHLVSKRMNV
jgi:glycopeptide antibiotics resistance protein